MTAALRAQLTEWGAAARALDDAEAMGVADAERDALDSAANSVAAQLVEQVARQRKDNAMNAPAVGPELLQPYKATGQRVTIRRHAAPDIDAATLPDVEVVRVGRIGALLNEPRRHGRGRLYRRHHRLRRHSRPLTRSRCERPGHHRWVAGAHV